MQHVFSLLNFLAPTQEQAFCVSLEAPETIFMISDCSLDTFLSHRHSARPSPPKSVLRALLDDTDASETGTYHVNIRFVSGKCRVRHSPVSRYRRLRLGALRVRLTCLRLRFWFLTGSNRRKKKTKTRQARNPFATVGLRFAFATFRSSEGGRLHYTPSTAERLHYTPHATLRATSACMNSQRPL